MSSINHLYVIWPIKKARLRNFNNMVAISKYLNEIQRVYPPTLGLKKEDILRLVENPFEGEWNLYRQKCSQNNSFLPKWKDFKSFLQERFPNTFIELRNPPAIDLEPGLSIHIILPEDKRNKKLILQKSAITNVLGMVYVDYEIINIENPIIELKSFNPLLYKTRLSFTPQSEMFYNYAKEVKKWGAEILSHEFLDESLARFHVNNVVYPRASSSYDPTSSIIYFLLFGENIW